MMPHKTAESHLLAHRRRLVLNRQRARGRVPYNIQEDLLLIVESSSFSFSFRSDGAFEFL